MRILGDVQDYDLPKSEFDLIVCWWLLEHPWQPKGLLKTVANLSKRMELIIVAVPNVYSIKVLLTKYLVSYLGIQVYFWSEASRNRRSTLVIHY